jgi:hypothetical protein
MLLAVLGALALPAAAQNATTDSSDTVKVAAQKSSHYKMWPEEFDNYRRTYELSNGRTLTVGLIGSMRYASLDGAPRHKLIATGHGSFETEDRMIMAQIHLGEGEQVSGEVSYVDDRAPRVGSLEPALIRVALR